MSEKNYFKPLLGPCEVHQLEPFAYPWAWDMYKIGRKNEWTPEEIGMGADVAHWKDPDLDPVWRQLFLYMMGMLTTMDMDRGDDAAITFMRVYQPAEIRQYFKRLVMEEAGHTESYRFCVENMSLPASGPDSVYDMWQYHPAMKAKITMGDEISGKMNDIINKYGHEVYKATTKEKKQLFLGTLYWHLLFEGVWFWMGLAGPIQHLSYNLKRFMNTAEQFAYIAKDESMHIRFGIELCRAWMVQYPEVMNETTLSQIAALCHKVVDIEQAFISEALPGGGILGYTVKDHMYTTKWFVNFRLHAIGLEAVFKEAPINVAHPFHWMSAALETKKEKNFFETRVQEYQVGGAIDWGEVPNTPIDQLDGHLHDKEWTK